MTEEIQLSSSEQVRSVPEWYIFTCLFIITSFILIQMSTYFFHFFFY